MSQRIGIKDVAAAAGVSPSTVSQVLNEIPGKRISAPTRARVQAAAKELDYSPNSIARGLRLQRTQTLAVINDLVATTPFAGDIFLGAQEAALERGWLLLLVTTLGDAETEAREIKALRRHQVDGYLYAAMYHHEVTLPAALADVPKILVNASSADPSVSSVVPDEEAGARTAIRDLVRRGHRRIAFVVEDSQVPAAIGRMAGYRAALDEAALPFDPDLVERVPGSGQPVRAATIRLLELPEPPSAIFCFSDRFAMSVYQAASIVGVAIPTQLSVMGFDDQRILAEGLFPQLTTVALPHYQMGYWGVHQLIAEIEGDATRPVAQIRLECPLIERESTAAPPGALR